MVGKSEGKEQPTTVGSEFAWQPKPGNPKTFKNYNHAKASACNQVLEEATADFGIKAWGLARLLGLPWLHQIYQWLDGTQRPCQMYMTRLVKLYQLKSQGLRLITVHHIDWDGSGEIHFKEIVTFMPDGSVQRRQTISPQDEELKAKWMQVTPR